MEILWGWIEQIFTLVLIIGVFAAEVLYEMCFKHVMDRFYLMPYY